MRKLLTIHGHHHSKAEADRLYVPRKQGGRGLMQLEAAHAVEITKIDGIYIFGKEDTPIQIVRTHQLNTNPAVLQTTRYLKAEVQRETKIKVSIAEKTKERWHGKRMHGQLRM